MTIRESVAIDEVISFLNDLVIMDERALFWLVTTSAICNSKLANHPLVQVRKDDRCYRVGVIGILNGLFGVDADGWGAIVAVFNSESSRLIGFRRTNDRDKGK